MLTLCLLLLLAVPRGGSAVRTVPRRSSALRMDSTLSAPKCASYDAVPLKDLVSGVELRSVTGIQRPSVFKNRYFGLRHGESTANLAGVISSDPVVGASIHGLTGTGQAQARRAAVDLVSMIGRENLLTEGKVLFMTSPFLRARETAAEALDAINRLMAYENEPVVGNSPSSADATSAGGITRWMVPPPTDRCILLDECDLAPSFDLPTIPLLIRESLRERWFGQLDAKPLIFYNKVWPFDQLDAANTRSGVESVQMVCERCASLLAELEEEFDGKIIIFSSHADTLQIFQLFMSGHPDPRQFASYRFRNGELRDMQSLQYVERVEMIYR